MEAKFLYNIARVNQKHIKKAAKLRGFDIYIEDTAYRRDKTINPELVAVYTREPKKDHRKMWDKYDKLCEGRK